MVWKHSSFYCQDLRGYGFSNSWPPRWMNGIMSERHLFTLSPWKDSISKNAEIHGQLRNIYYFEHRSKFTLPIPYLMYLNSATHSKVCEFSVRSKIGNISFYILYVPWRDETICVATIEEKAHFLNMKWKTDIKNIFYNHRVSIWKVNFTDSWQCP